MPGGDALKVTLVSVAVLSRGRKGAVIDLDDLATATDRKRSTLPGYLNRLVTIGWLTKGAVFASTNRAVVVFETAKSISG
jgi:hypothetical protein